MTAVRARRLLLWLAGLLVLLWLTLPTLIIIPVSFTDKASFLFPPKGWSLRWYRNLFEDPAWRDAALNSVLIAALSALIAVVLGTAAAVGLFRWGRLRGREPIRAALLTPLIIPEIVLGIGIYAAFLRLGLVGTLPGFLLAHSALGIPMVVTTVLASLASFDENLERAAASLGAGPWSTARQVTLPLVSPGLIAGALFALILSFDNVVISIFLQTPALTTLPVLIWSSMTRDTDPTIAAAASLILLFTVSVLALALWIMGRRTQRTKKGILL